MFKNPISNSQMIVIKSFLLLLVLSCTFNVVYNLKCYSCDSKECLPTVKNCITCPPLLPCDLIVAKIIFHADSCVSSKYHKDGEEFTYKGCGSDLKKTLQIVGVTRKDSEYSECSEDLCNEAERVSASSLFTVFIGSVLLVLYVLF